MDRDKNREVGGKKGSQHLIFGALDGQPIEPTLEKVQQMHAVALELRGTLFEVPAGWKMVPVPTDSRLLRVKVPHGETWIWDPRAPEAPTLARWMGGVGIYPDEDEGLFLHVDARGFRADW